ncbi:S1 family peptidase [Streptomyces sp. CBMA152]|uniref:S1 family peptidase n=1 Tax=Streptomyces sp. CBMA152 TaxID=1896312 RepID=UPI0016610B65|nr:S1 family peptidase [Streptomyces sp. CBMA152]MBD0741063.1 streptogrisin [Streptomyces sp. CBMA152]
MKQRTTSGRRRAATAAAGALALTGAMLATQSATAAPASPGTDGLTAVSAGRLAHHVESALLGRTAGSYYDRGANKLVVNVVDNGAADAVRDSGAEPRLVKHSMAQLNAARQELKAKASIPGTAWSMDPVTNKIVVKADRTVTGERLAKLSKVVRGLGDTAVLKTTPGRFRPLIAGGDAIWGSSARCSLGFNVTVGGQPYFLTAGHCGNAVSNWSDQQGGSDIGVTEASTFPGHDYALVRYVADVDHPSAVDTYDGSSQPISGAGYATVGEQVQRSGSTTGVYGGQVTGLNATVTYQEGQVDGLIDTTVCAEPGDSGGSLFDGGTALGLTSGGSGDCSSGGETFFQPVPDALNAYGAQIG